ncbi:ROK family protein [Breznakia pachnodae]|uniref:NBD/HSP70 family sugar kinase n=1 Tax=Breznakia pachnodae TaxID=265178 RepID=A0ABU0E556_9FIRM|nr:ROK family protein [Breznakia pachnodae]MDQ0361823.1 putative NBD/HSP70 family sugar kinase [Breznakia pachnodae]
MKKLVFDVGASAIKYALMDNEANIYEKGSEKTPQDSLDSFLAILNSIYTQFEKDIDGIAMSLPGTIDSTTGQIYAPGGLLYNANVNLIERMKEFTSLPITLENDGKSAALAEVWKGHLQDVNDGIVLVLGSGIGGGIIKDKKLWRGSHLFAGEFSFIMQNGTFAMENVFAMRASTSALVYGTAARKQIAPDTLDGHKVFNMIDNNDEDALMSLQNMCKSLAVEIFNLQCILDPQKFLIGGGISQQNIVIEKVREELDLIYDAIPFEVPRAALDACRYYNDSNLIGALYNFLSIHNLGTTNEK